MNTTKNISMGGYAFIVEEDAFARLRAYTGAVKRNLEGSPGADEIMDDIEVRIAEILRENMAGREVVKNEDVSVVISRMGEPDVYVQDRSGESKRSHAETADMESGERRLHRDPDNKILGGVCGGLGAYMSVDPIWFRLAFALTFWFYSTGFWVYLILWIIMPVAKTRIQKLQMRGKRPDLKNIENSIRSEINEVSSSLNKMANDKSIRDNIGDIFSRLFTVLGKLLEIFLKVVAGIVSVFSLAFLVFLIFMMMTGTSSIHVSENEVNVDNIRTVIPHIFESHPEGWMFYGFAFVFLAVPTIALLANSVRFLANIRTRSSKWVGLAGVGIWLMATAGLVYSGIRLGLDFSRRSTGKTERVIELPAGQSLRLHLEERPKVLESLAMSDVSLDIRESADSSYILRIYKEAAGRTEAEADRRQRSIDYHPVLKDSVLSFPELYMLQKNEVVRAQSVNMELHVPRNRRIYIESGMQRLLDRVDNVQHMYGSEMTDQYWIMTDRGLSCLHCPVPEPDSAVTDKK